MAVGRREWCAGKYFDEDFWLEIFVTKSSLSLG